MIGVGHHPANSPDPLRAGGRLNPQTNHKQQMTMETIQALKRQRKDDLIEKVTALTKSTEEMSEKQMGAAVLGALVGLLLGAALF